MKRIKKLISSERGTVAMEFILMLPIYLLMLGVTMLIFEISMGKLHLQEANRNLAWGAGDRHFDRARETNGKLIESVSQYYTERNKLEKVFGSDEEYWNLGSNQKYWGVSIIRKETEQGLFLPGTEWGMLAAGNMELRMNRSSSAFLGLIAVGYTDPANAGDTPLYEQSFDLTRTSVPKSDTVVAGLDFRPESYLFRRRYFDVGRPMGDVFSVIGESWPSIDDGKNTGGGGGSPSNPSDPNSGNDTYKRVFSSLTQ